MKLNVLLAKLEQSSAQFKAIVRDYCKFFKNNSSDFRGVKNTYEPRPDTQDNPSMRSFTAVVTTVDEKLDYFASTMKQGVQEMFDCEATNASGLAKANLILDGKLIGRLSSLELLKLKSFLENPQLVDMLSTIPVRSDAEVWEPTIEDAYIDRKIVASPKLVGVKKTITKEQYILKDPNISSGNITNYVPQVAVRDTVVEIGDYTSQKFSGEWTARQRAAVLKRRSDLLSATIAALKEANEAEAVSSELKADWLLGFLTGKEE